MTWQADLGGGGQNGAAPNDRGGRVVGRWLAGVAATVVAGVATTVIINGLTHEKATFTFPDNLASTNTNNLASVSPRISVGPGSPVDLRGTNATDTSLTIAWDGPTGEPAAVAYKVLRDGQQLATQAARTYTDRGLTPVTTYSYSVEAIDAAGNASSPGSPVALQTLADKIPPRSPGDFRVVDRGSTSISVAWSAATDDVAVTGYVLHWTDSTVGRKNTVSTSRTAYTLTGLSGGHEIFFDVAAQDAAGNLSRPSSLQELTVSAFDFSVTADTGPTACGYYSSTQPGVFYLQIPVIAALSGTLPGADIVLDLSSPYLENGADTEHFGGLPPSGSQSVLAEPLALISAQGKTIQIHVEIDKVFRAEETDSTNNSVDITIPLPATLSLDNGVYTLPCS